MEKTLPKGWEKKKLGEVANIRRGASPRPMGDPRYFGGNIPWIRISDIHKNGKFLKETEGHVTEEGAKRSVYLKVGSLIMAMAASIGTPCFLAVDGCIHDGFVVFEDLSAELDKEFLYHFIISFKNQFTNLAPEGTQKNLNTGIIKSAKIPLPPLPTQHRIVEILEKADSLRKLRQKADEKMKNLIPSLFVQMFGDPTTNPNGWEVVKLSNIAEFKRGPFGGSLKKEIFVKEGYKVYEQKNAIYNDFNIGNYFIDKKKYDEMVAFTVQPGDLIVSCSGTMGKIAIAPHNINKGVINQALLKITPNQSIVSPLVLKMLIESKAIQGKYFENAAGSAMQNVTSVKVLKHIEVPLPPLPRQQEFAVRVEEIETEKERQTESKKKLDELFNSLMQRAFKGELVA